MAAVPSETRVTPATAAAAPAASPANRTHAGEPLGTECLYQAIEPFAIHSLPILPCDEIRTCGASNGHPPFPAQLTSNQVSPWLSFANPEVVAPARSAPAIAASAETPLPDKTFDVRCCGVETVRVAAQGHRIAGRPCTLPSASTTGVGWMQPASRPRLETARATRDRTSPATRHPSPGLKVFRLMQVYVSSYEISASDRGDDNAEMARFWLIHLRCSRPLQMDGSIASMRCRKR